MSSPWKPKGKHAKGCPWQVVLVAQHPEALSGRLDSLNVPKPKAAMGAQKQGPRRACKREKLCVPPMLQV